MSSKFHTESIDPKKIILPDGFLKSAEHDEMIAGLVDSIGRQGMLHHPIIKENYEVVVGKKRIAAALKLRLETINCTVVPSDEQPEYYRGLSLHENLKRHNLPWYDQIMLEKELHEMRQEEHGKGRSGKKSGWALRDTAQELEMSLGILSEDLRMAEAIMVDPTLKRIENRDTARRYIFNTLKRVTQEMDSRPSTDVEDLINKVHLGGAESLLRLYPDCSFDACITDPPWLKFRDDKLTKDEYTLSVFPEIFRVLKQNSFLYMFVSTPDFKQYFIDLPKMGFKVQEMPLIWIKEGVLSHGNLSWQYQRDYEPILLAVKGSPALTNSMLSAIISCKIVPPQKMIHPNEKPPEVIKRIIDHCTYAGALVLDPFAGSGVVLETAKFMGRSFVGMEIDHKAYGKILSRLGLDKPEEVKK